jgi:uncharacterized cofD-like protein
MHLVTLGSGTGQATLLRGLRSYACQVTAIVGVTDNGGHSGELRRILDLPQVGDTRQCLSALVDETCVWGQLLQHRFTTGELCGLSVGNLMLAALSTLHGSFSAAVAAFGRAAGLRQRVVPVSDTNTHIAAELQDGRQLIGEWEIIQRQPRSDVVRLFLQPSAAALPAVLEAIATADVLVLCPGSLLTGMIPVLLHTGVREAMAATSAWCLYVGNLMTQPGQTDGYTATQHLDFLHRYLGRQVDAVLLNSGVIPADLLAYYAQQGSEPVLDDVTEVDLAVYRADLTEHPTLETIHRYQRPQGEAMQVGLHVIRHDAHKLAAQIMALAMARQAGADEPSQRVFR